MKQVLSGALFGALLLSVTATAALAQGTAPTPAPANTLGATGTSTPGVLATQPTPPIAATEPARAADAPVPGANSFTEGQARARMEERGYTNLTAMRKDNHGIWRGTGTKDGQQVAVALDYQGNVTVE